jgi:hypothetical protein
MPDGTVVASSEEGVVALLPDGTALEGRDRRAYQPRPDAPRGQPCMSATNGQAIASDGKTRWRVPAESSGAPAIGADGTLYVSCMDGVRAISPRARRCGIRKLRCTLGRSLTRRVTSTCKGRQGGPCVSCERFVAVERRIEATEAGLALGRTARCTSAAAGRRGLCACGSCTWQVVGRRGIPCARESEQQRSVLQPPSREDARLDVRRLTGARRLHPAQPTAGKSAPAVRRSRLLTPTWPCGATLAHELLHGGGPGSPGREAGSVRVLPSGGS